MTRLYEDDQNYFVLLTVKYRLDEFQLRVEAAHFVPIEFLAWDCLTVGALGAGQIQIANANHINIIDDNSRKQWMLELCEVMLDFYPREISKITDRIDYIESVKQTWQGKPDIWIA